MRNLGSFGLRCFIMFDFLHLARLNCVILRRSLLRGYMKLTVYSKIEALSDTLDLTYQVHCLPVGHKNRKSLLVVEYTNLVK